LGTLPELGLGRFSLTKNVMVEKTVLPKEEPLIKEFVKQRVETAGEGKSWEGARGEEIGGRKIREETIKDPITGKEKTQKYVWETQRLVTGEARMGETEFWSRGALRTVPSGAENWGLKSRFNIEKELRQRFGGAQPGETAKQAKSRRGNNPVWSETRIKEAAATLKEAAIFEGSSVGEKGMPVEWERFSTTKEKIYPETKGKPEGKEKVELAPSDVDMMIRRMAILEGVSVGTIKEKYAGIGDVLTESMFRSAPSRKSKWFGLGIRTTKGEGGERVTTQQENLQRKYLSALRRSPDLWSYTKDSMTRTEDILKTKPAGKDVVDALRMEMFLQSGQKETVAVGIKPTIERAQDIERIKAGMTVESEARFKDWQAEHEAMKDVLAIKDVKAREKAFRDLTGSIEGLPVKGEKLVVGEKSAFDKAREKARETGRPEDVNAYLKELAKESPRGAAEKLKESIGREKAGEKVMKELVEPKYRGVESKYGGFGLVPSMKASGKYVPSQGYKYEAKPYDYGAGKYEYGYEYKVPPSGKYEYTPAGYKPSKYDYNYEYNKSSYEYKYDYNYNVPPYKPSMVVPGIGFGTGRGGFGVGKKPEKRYSPSVIGVEKGIFGKAPGWKISKGGEVSRDDLLVTGTEVRAMPDTPEMRAQFAKLQLGGGGLRVSQSGLGQYASQFSNVYGGRKGVVRRSSPVFQRSNRPAPVSVLRARPVSGQFKSFGNALPRQNNNQFKSFMGVPKKGGRFSNPFGINNNNKKASINKNANAGLFKIPKMKRANNNAGFAKLGLSNYGGGKLDRKHLGL